MYIKSFVVATIVGLATTSPLEKRQTGTTSKEFSQGGCRDILFAFARGSTEAGNMGTIVGPQTSNGLKAQFGASTVATEGIDYAALLSTNALPGGTDAASKNLMKGVLNAMAIQCPDSVIVAAGYSQGAAVCHRAIEELSGAVKDRIVGVVTYGDTQKQQDNGQIPNFPKDKVKIICQPGDLVCVGTLTVLPPHLTYGARAGEGVQFLAQKIQGAQKKMKARKDEELVGRAAEGLEKV
ncbi:cutinase precursor [Lindgomyces ingoldianus]|uniref:Cutinase n=1 Tax=Lindgomyces ingoldianus TaxID=673940 RepID=A0ACB6Q7V5_9PLEO|nr:cutinase precursor [Lindgomyces ingoldianus]KAF2462964.1 cutinase precursor [Lindgomyces ingoldianus]